MIHIFETMTGPSSNRVPEYFLTDDEENITSDPIDYIEQLFELAEDPNIVDWFEANYVHPLQVTIKLKNVKHLFSVESLKDLANMEDNFPEFLV